ncbi:MAG: hypothetical protein QJR03_02945 [Sphaerobacter sp.]|nr:hypothetical protein [Sphaerobacter sp.]
MPNGSLTAEQDDAGRRRTALTDIIAAHGSTVEQVVDALVADAKTRLDQAVADGRLTQAQAAASCPGSGTA